MKIAQITPLYEAVPPKLYGGTERVVAHLTDAAALTQWAQAHPQGLVFGRVNENPLTVEPQRIFQYMGQDWGIWPAVSISRE